MHELISVSLEKVVKQISMLLIQRGKNVYLLLSVKLMGMNIGKN